jgi:hypothetical protein
LDASGNADFCETYVIIQDNMGVCENGPNATVAGALKTDVSAGSEGVQDAKVDLNGTSNGVPVFSQVFSDLSGSYTMSNALPLSSSAIVTPNLNADPLNGVYTYDLVLISRHILGLEALNTPYKLIAADANKNGQITTFDVVELRKLILGVYSELPNNDSWRFVDKTQVFADPNNPFAETIRESLSIANIQANMMNGDFTGVKIGDVDLNAEPNELVSSDERSVGTMLFDVDDREVKAGEIVEVSFKAAQQVLGYQFTMNLNDLSVLDIVPGAGMSIDNFAVFNDAITTSVNGVEGQFTVKFRAAKAGKLSQMLSVSSRITKAVAYSLSLGEGRGEASGEGRGEALAVAFRFNNGSTSTIAGVGFELYQNQPNPFMSHTVVGFHLPAATEATLTIFDETGRQLYQTKGQYAKGYNAINLDRQLMPSTGVLYYELKTATDQATKKMIKIK